VCQTQQPQSLVAGLVPHHRTPPSTFLHYFHHIFRTSFKFKTMRVPAAAFLV
jgi:hypothetical protein